MIGARQGARAFLGVEGLCAIRIAFVQEIIDAHQARRRMRPIVERALQRVRDMRHRDLALKIAADDDQHPVAAMFERGELHLDFQLSA